jgi:hypothetical protein
VTTYHFNAANQPNLVRSAVRWAAVVTNIHYSFFLVKRFPGSQWFPITHRPSEDGGSAVGIIPVTKENRVTLEKWLNAHRYFHELNVQAENMMNNPESYKNALRKLPEGYPSMEGDPFLESCFGEWIAQYHEGPDYSRNIKVIQRAIQKGYPSANLYYKLGNFFLLNHQNQEARKSYLMAVHAKPNYTNVKDSLAYLDHLENK